MAASNSGVNSRSSSIRSSSRPRISQSSACDSVSNFYMGRLVEYADTRNIFTNPANPQTEAYVSGRFG